MKTEMKKLICGIWNIFTSWLFVFFKDLLVNYVIVPITKHFIYPFTYRTNVAKLGVLTEQLNNRTLRLQDSVGVADDNVEAVYQNVRNFLSESETVIEEARLVLATAEAETKYFFGLLPNLKTRYLLSKKAELKAFAINLLLGKEVNVLTISHRRRRQQHVGPSVFDLEKLDSRLSIRKQVMDALKDPNLSRIGVYGMSGVGKSTLAKEVHRLALTEKLFDDVVFVAVSGEHDQTGAIQRIIADVLGVNFAVENREVRASHLIERIKDKKILIILDNIQQKIDLDDIGIPTGAKGEGCKVLLTSWKNDMGAEKEFMLQILNDQEARKMFEKIVPHANDSQFDNITSEIVKKCSGHPMLIKLVAGYLQKCEELGSWKEKLRQLSNFEDREIESKVCVSLKSSYNLMHDNVKSFFLLCALSQESDIRIQYLLRYSIGLGLIGESVATDTTSMHPSYNESIQFFINELQNCCLLMKGDMDGYVKMHDIVRKATLSIARNERLAFTSQSGVRLTRLPDSDCSKISLSFSNHQELTGQFEVKDFKFKCPNADLLLLFTEDISLKVSQSFFDGIQELKVLNFTGMRFRYLPSSIIKLKNLQTLCLHCCHLDNLFLIRHLKQLKILSFVDSCIVKLPKEIEELTHLKILDLTNCSKLNVIPANVFSKLKMLEELYMSNSFVEWEAKGNASLKEFKHLSHLTTLEMKVLNCDAMRWSLFTNLKSLKNYKIVIGDVSETRLNNESARMLKLKFKKSIFSEPGVRKFLKETDDLYVDEVHENVLHDPGRDGHWNLKHLIVQNDRAIQHIVNSTSVFSDPAFPILQSLFLDNLISLENLCNDSYVRDSFNKLKSLEVRNCEKLETLFLLFCDDRQDTVKVNLTELSSLTLVNLPLVKSFCIEREEPLESSSIDEELTANDPAFQEGILSENQPKSDYIEPVSLWTKATLWLCAKLSTLWLLAKLSTQFRSFCNTREVPPESIIGSFSNTKEVSPESTFNGLVSLPNLENLTISSLSCKRIWQDHLCVTSSNLTSLTVHRCRNLQGLFTSSTVRSLLQLKNIEIKNCKLFEEIILTEESVKETKGTTEILFPKLESLRLKGLPKLNRFCVGHQIKFQSLKQLHIKNCAALTTLVADNRQANSQTRFLFNGMVEFPKLKELRLSKMKNLENIWPSQLPNSFSRLKILIIQDCQKLSMIFPSGNSSIFKRLGFLNIKRCHSLQETFPFQEPAREMSNYSPEEFENILSMVEPQTSFTFEDVQLVEVADHGHSKNIFSSPTATNFSQLESLTIRRYKSKEL
ncbi:disease resistance protein RPS2-like [Mercurialis annua]|uniref:disease resistance protein RPS2-like n=1 Tax=Mercurialis annua TaxID=3986 RepID=UPI00215E14AA|nr:disease resistance protein RPS2-like [Mercurialis annua]